MKCPAYNNLLEQNHGLTLLLSFSWYDQDAFHDPTKESKKIAFSRFQVRSVLNNI